MYLLDLTLNSPAENLALDEALLDWAEAPGSDHARGEEGGEVLRLWEPAEPFVVLGRASRAEQEVDRAACQRLGIPVLRRASGGAAVVVGPGCLMYAVVLSYDLWPQLRMLDAAHHFVLTRVAEAVSQIADRVTPAGTSDLVLGHAPPQKFSGNSLRCKRTHFLYHGTLLYDFDIRLIEACLVMPPRQPDYRGGRSHTRFLANLPASGADLRAALAGAWQASMPLASWPREQTASLARSRYACDEWTWNRSDGTR
jgi:lipoate-protein ligase A